MAHEREVDSVAFQNLRVTLFELLLDVSWTHSVEAEVLKNVPEQVVGDGELTLFKVVIKAFLEVGRHLGRQVADVELVRSLGNFLDLGGLSRRFGRHFYFLK